MELPPETVFIEYLFNTKLLVFAHGFYQAIIRVLMPELRGNSIP